MKVIIAEKPSVAREIARVFGANQKREGYIEGKGHLPGLLGIYYN
jgi:DNA topoisomerase-3